MSGELLRELASLMRDLKRLGSARRGKARGGADSAVGSGQEALRAAVLLTLRAGDMICDLSGSELGRATAAGSALRWLELPAVAGGGPGALLLGAAVALRTVTAGAVLLALVPAAELRRPEWRRAAEAAGGLAVPLVLVALLGEGEPVRLPRTVGLPLIPVDAEDAVALCRVLAESCLRARNGDGPSLIRAMRWQLPVG